MISWTRGLGRAGRDPARAAEAEIPPAVRPRGSVILGAVLAVAALVVYAMATSGDRAVNGEVEPGPRRRVAPPGGAQETLPFVEAAEAELAREREAALAGGAASADGLAAGSDLVGGSAGEAGQPGRVYEAYGSADSPGGGGSGASASRGDDERLEAYRRALRSDPVHSYADEGSTATTRSAVPDVPGTGAAQVGAAPVDPLAAPLPAGDALHEYEAFLQEELERVRGAGVGAGMGAPGAAGDPASPANPGARPSGVLRGAGPARFERISESLTVNAGGPALPASAPPAPAAAPPMLPHASTSHVPAAGAGPRGYLRLAARTLISGALVTAVNSDLPGQMVGQVTRDVYDSRMRTVLVPRGSFLIGDYSNQVALGQNRLLVAWTRLELPNGAVYELPGLRIADVAGASGLEAEVQNHYGRVFGNAALLSVVAAGLQLSQPAQEFGESPTAQQQMAGAAGLELGRVATEVIRRNLRIAPTLRIRQGTAFRVFVGRDVLLPPYRGRARRR